MKTILTDTDTDTCIGKTIENVAMSEKNLILSFADNTFIVFEIDTCPEVEPWLRIDDTFNPYGTEYVMSPCLHKAQLLSGEELKVEKEKIEQKRQEIGEARDRRIYEQLKKKFEELK